MSTAPSAADVAGFRAAIAERLGLQFDDDKLPFLTGVLRQRMEATGKSHALAYIHRLGTNERSEIRALAAQLTVGETYFFRYWDQFRAFTEVVVPDCLRHRGDARVLRILSAGCASGEEAHSIAIVLCANVPDRARWAIDLRGVDINPSAIERATAGRYTEWSLREAPEELRSRYFKADGRGYDLDPAIRAMASFEERNLLDDDPQFWAHASHDVIFCRNVLMYFAPDVMPVVVARLAKSLRPGGYLFLGHAETLRGLSQDFHLCHTHGTFYYQRRSGAVTVPRPRDPSGASPSSLPDTGGWTNPQGDETSWIASIQRATERIAKLESERGSSAASGDRVQEDAPLTAEESPLDLRPAVELLRQERFLAAIELLGDLPPRAAADSDAQLLRAVLLTNSGQSELAQRACTELLAMDELSAGAHYLMALGREQAGDRAGAIEHHQVASYLDSRFAMPRLHLGLLARKAGDLDAARTHLHAGLRLLAAEDASRILLFGGGFAREALGTVFEAELNRCGGAR